MRKGGAGGATRMKSVTKNKFLMEQIHEMEAFIKFLAGIPKDNFQQRNLKIKKHFPLYFCFSKPEQSTTITNDDAGFSIVFPNGAKKCYYFTNETWKGSYSFSLWDKDIHGHVNRILEKLNLVVNRLKTRMDCPALSYSLNGAFNDNFSNQVIDITKSFNKETDVNYDTVYAINVQPPLSFCVSKSLGKIATLV
jgi:hypothetical protein